MFNHHLSQSHPPPVHRSEETGLRNPLHPVQNKSWQSLLLALVQRLCDLARLSAVDQIDITYLLYCYYQAWQILHKHTDRHIVYSDLLLQTITVIFEDLY